MAPRENENNAYAKFWGYKQRALWYVMVFSGVVNSRLLAMTDARSRLERPLSLASWSINVVFGRPLERLLCFGSQSISWETVSFLLLEQWPL